MHLGTARNALTLRGNQENETSNLGVRGSNPFRRALVGQNPWRSGRPGSGEDQFGEGWDDGASENRQPGTEIIPERDVKLGAGLGEAKEGIAAVATEIAASAAANLAPGDVAADVVFRSVGV